MGFDFTGKRILVTGGAKGLGRGLVISLLRAGGTVFTIDNNEADLQKLKEEYPKVNTILLDLLDWEATEKVVGSIAPLDHLVNNAGLWIYGEYPNWKSEDIDKMFGVNFKAAVNVSQTFAKGRAGLDLPTGSIVNISSPADTLTFKGRMYYSCSKAALSMLTKCLAVELGPNIRVNTVRPGYMETDMSAQCTRDHGTEVMKGLLDKLIIKRPVDVDDTCNLVMFLLSPLSGMITGENVIVDGGKHLG